MKIKIWICPRCGFVLRSYDKIVLPIYCRCEFKDHGIGNIRLVDSDITEEQLKEKRAARGYGIPQEYTPLPPPEKPTDLPLEVMQWLEDQEQ